MVIQINVISKEIIKPSSPTPKSLQKHQLSIIDQVTPHIFMPLVYFYSSNPSIPNSQKSNHLKKSLSETLSRFYPLAGRLVGNLHVHCNDGGVPFFEAEANHDLSEATNKPNPKTLTNLFPHNLSESPNLCMAVQATFFCCGGIAIGTLISHKIADASSFFLLVNSWSAVARNGDFRGMPIPEFDGAANFPPLDISGFDHHKKTRKEDQLESRIFTFPADKISLLREKYSCGGKQRRPSRVEAVSAHIWTRFLSSTGMQSDPSKIYSFALAVDLRTRMNGLSPSEHLFGNIAGLSILMPAAEDGGAELSQKIRQANEGGYDNFMALLKRKNPVKDLLHQINKRESLVSFIFTSLCGFPMYEADFGWGKPVWVGTPGFFQKNSIILKNTRSGDGVEALICLSKQDMEKFEVDFDLRLKSNL